MYIINEVSIHQNPLKTNNEKFIIKMKISFPGTKEVHSQDLSLVALTQRPGAPSHEYSAPNATPAASGHQSWSHLYPRPSRGQAIIIASGGRDPASLSTLMGIQYPRVMDTVYQSLQVSSSPSIKSYSVSCCHSCDYYLRLLQWFL